MRLAIAVDFAYRLPSANRWLLAMIGMDQSDFGKEAFDARSPCRLFGPCLSGISTTHPNLTAG